MQATRYEAPTTVDGAIELLRADPGARVIAGGTDLLVQFRTGRVEPTVFVDIKRIPDLMSIHVDGDGLRLGAGTPCAQIFESQDVHAHWPGLAEATDLIGSSQIQGRATLGGNLCNASPAADTVPALIVCSAQVVIAGPSGERTVAAEDFVRGPGANALEPGEFVVQIRAPKPAARTADAYLRLIPRSEMDIAVVGAGVSVTLDKKGKCTAARVAIGAVAPTARLVPAAADALIGTSIDGEALERAAAAASAAAEPIDDKRGTRAYRVKVTGVLVKRAAAIAAERARERS